MGTKSAEESVCPTEKTRSDAQSCLRGLSEELTSKETCKSPLDQALDFLRHKDTACKTYQRCKKERFATALYIGN